MITCQHLKDIFIAMLLPLDKSSISTNHASNFSHQKNVSTRYGIKAWKIFGVAFDDWEEKEENFQWD